MLYYLHPWMYVGGADVRKRKRELLAGCYKNKPQALYDLGYMAYKDGDHYLAAKWLNKCVVIPGPLWPKASVIMGTIRYGQNDLRNAEFYWKQAAEAGNSSAMFNLAVLLKNSGRMNGAIGWFEKAAAKGHVQATKSLQKIKSQPAPRYNMSDREAELHAARWMVHWGFHDAKATPVGADGGIDVVASNAMAQVKNWSNPVGIKLINEFQGASSTSAVKRLFFAKSGYTKQALARADECEMALFIFSDEGHPKAANDVAHGFLRMRG